MKLLYVILVVVLSSCTTKPVGKERVYIGSQKVETLEISLKVFTDKEGGISSVFIKGFLFYTLDMAEYVPFFIEVEQLKKQSHNNYTFTTDFGGPGKRASLGCKLNSLNINGSSLQLKFIILTSSSFNQEEGYTFNCKRVRK